MEKITKAEALRRWNSAKMREMLYDDYKTRTGEEPVTFNVL